MLNAQDKLGIDDLVKVVTLACDLINAAKPAFSGDLRWWDEVKLILSMKESFNSSLTIDRSKLVPELKDLNQEEYAQLMEVAKARLHLPQGALAVLEYVKLVVPMINGAHLLYSQIKGGVKTP